MTNTAASTTSLRSIAGIALVLIGGIAALLAILLLLTGVWLCIEGAIFSGHIPGALVLGQAMLIGAVSRLMLRRGLKIQAEVQSMESEKA